MYKADIEYRLLCRADRVPSYEDMVFWRDMGWNDEEEAVEARDGVCSMIDMLSSRAFGVGIGVGMAW